MAGGSWPSSHFPPTPADLCPAVPDRSLASRRAQPGVGSTPMTPAPERLRQEDHHKLRASLYYIPRSSKQNRETGLAEDAGTQPLQSQKVKLYPELEAQ